MLAPYSKELKRLRSEDPTLEGRIQAAFDEAKRDGHDRYAFVEIEGGRTLIIENFATNPPPSSRVNHAVRKTQSKKWLGSVLSVFGF